MLNSVSPSKLIKTIIVEDEIHSRNYLRKCLQRHQELEIVAECTDGKNAINKIFELKPDLLFLDIGIPDPDGFGVLNSLPAEIIPLIIFITAHEDYALKAFDYFAFDYILKPYEDARVNISVERAIKSIYSSQLADEAKQTGLSLNHTNEKTLFLPIKSKNKTILLPVKDIDRVESFGDYVKIHSGDKQYLYYATMNEMEDKLRNDFIRIHRSSLVRIDQIKEYYTLLHGDGRIILRDGINLRVSRNYRDNLKRIVKKI